MNRIFVLLSIIIGVLMSCDMPEPDNGLPDYYRQIEGIEDVPLHGVVSSDSSIFVVSRSNDNNYKLINFSRSLNHIWTMSLPSSLVVVNELLLTTDSNLIIAGSQTKQSGDVSSLWVSKMALSGDVIWEYSSSANSDEKGNGIAETENGTFLVCGTYQSLSAGMNKEQPKLWEFDQSGQLTWDTIYNTTPGTEAMSVAHFETMGDCQVGLAISTPAPDTFDTKSYELWCLNNDRSLHFVRALSGYGGMYGGNIELVKDSRDNIITWRSVRDKDEKGAKYRLEKSDMNLDSVWLLQMANLVSIRDVVESQDENYLCVARKTRSLSIPENLVVLMVSKNGDLVWESTLDEEISSSPTFVLPLSKGEYLIGVGLRTGSKTFTGFYIVIDADGNPID